MLRKAALYLTVVIPMVCLLTGCLFYSGEELYSLPQAPEDYLNLQEEINRVMSGGLEYVAPLSGTNTQLVQMVDLSGDGTGEAVAFFRDNSSDMPLKLYIFRQMEEGYQTVCVIEGAGTAINRVDYVDINGDGWKEIVISWQMSAKVQSISAYSVKDYEEVQLMQTSYTKYALYDLDQDNQTELVVLHNDAGGMSNNRVDYYDYEHNELVQLYSVPMSEGIQEITTVKVGNLSDEKPALFVESTLADNYLVTDIFAIQDDAFTCISRREDEELSKDTVRNYTVYSQDVDKDGVFEAPRPERLPMYQNTGSDNYWLIRWYQYDSAGRSQLAFSTYHNYSDGWFFILPDEWPEHITVSREDLVSGERTVVFSKWVDEQTPPVEFLKIYKLTGANREERSKLQNRFILKRDDSNADTIYVAEFVNQEQTSAFHLNQEEMIERFHLIISDWNIE